jgi:hypothetical protein
MVRINFFVLFFAIFLSSNSFAQSNISGGSGVNTPRKGHFINFNAPIERVGKGVVFWIDQNTDYGLTSIRHYSSCDGKILSDSLYFAVSFQDDPVKRINDIASQREEGQVSWQTDATHFYAYEDIDLSYKNLIKKNVAIVCKRAKAEKKGAQILISKSEYNPDGLASGYAFLTSTFSRDGDLLRGWLRKYDISREVRKKSDGSIITFNDGTPWYENKISDTGYQLEMWVLNCKKRQVDIMRVTAYEKSGAVLSNKSFESNKLDLRDVIPESIGEKVLVDLCRIY